MEGPYSEQLGSKPKPQSMLDQKILTREEVQQYKTLEGCFDDLQLLMNPLFVEYIATALDQKVVALREDRLCTCRFSVLHDGRQLEFLFEEPFKKALVESSPYNKVSLGVPFSLDLQFPLEYFCLPTLTTKEVKLFTAFGVEWALQVENDKMNTLWLTLQIPAAQTDSLTRDTQPFFDWVVSYKTSTSILEPPIRLSKEGIHFKDEVYSFKLLESSAKKEWIHKNRSASVFSLNLRLQVCELYSSDRERLRLQNQSHLRFVSLLNQESQILGEIEELFKKPPQELSKVEHVSHTSQLLLKLRARLLQVQEEKKRELMKQWIEDEVLRVEKRFFYSKIVFQTKTRIDKEEKCVVLRTGGAGQLEVVSPVTQSSPVMIKDPLITRGVITSSSESEEPLPWNPTQACFLSTTLTSLLSKLFYESFDVRGKLSHIIQKTMTIEPQVWRCYSSFSNNSETAFKVLHGCDLRKSEPCKDLKLTICKKLTYGIKTEPRTQLQQEDEELKTVPTSEICQQQKEFLDLLLGESTPSIDAVSDRLHKFLQTKECTADSIREEYTSCSLYLSKKFLITTE